MARMKVEGFRELERALDDLGNDRAAKRIGRAALKKAAQPVAEDAAARAPRDEKDTDGIVLAESLRVGTRLNKRQARRHKRWRVKGAVEMFVGVANEASAYGHHQEFGTQHHGAQPFLRPAWDANKDRMLDILRRELWAGIKRQLKRQAPKGGE